MSLKTVYLMRDPETRAIRYVGLTGKSLKQRLNGHIARRFKPDSTAEWIRGLMGRGLKPLMEVVEEVSEQHAECESKWIYHYRTAGEPLLNKVSLRESVYVAAPGTVLARPSEGVEAMLKRFPGVRVDMGCFVTLKKDEAVQSDAPDEFVARPPLKRRPRPRGTRGDRKAQASRYWRRNAVKLREYSRLYQAARRAAAKMAMLEED